MARPKTHSTLAEQEMNKAQEQFDNFDTQIKEMTQDRMNMAPKEEKEAQTLMSQADIAKSKEIYLKPKRTLGVGVHPKTGVAEKFNERFRDDYNFQKELVHFIAENNEIMGEDLDLWTKPFQGVPLENWIVPVNKPVWGPRYLAEQIKSKTYHRLTMRNHVVENSGEGQYYGTMAVDTTIQRLDARPVSSRKSLFMGSNAFA